ncbi:MAG: prepilin peptidase [Phenylobacterium sp.]|uniref:prepilin peptidase n=1 Tax=Phenylobacterium sp. TaxID=1871053 RepID=UPI002721AA9E|nr:A24 family peptidase [Phenylobacterium sp.]MDO8900115.1 prepilin peptidase [Phenylobacterium sp.]
MDLQADLAWLFAAVALGPFVGSFLGLMSLRLPDGRPVALARSACPACERRLGPIDLVPVLSYLALRGRCRTCGAPIPPRYLVLELACPALALWSMLVHPSAEGFLGALLAWQLLLLALLDAEHFWLPRALTLPLLVSGLAVAAAQGLLFDHALGAGIGFAGLSLLALAYRHLRGREGLGGGDAYLLAGGGAWCGAIALPSILLIAAASGLAFVLMQRLRGRPAGLDQPLPFGVFLAAGTWLTWLYGPLGLS